jgi:hypothetical protein
MGEWVRPSRAPSPPAACAEYSAPPRISSPRTANRPKGEMRRRAGAYSRVAAAGVHERAEFVLGVVVEGSGECR